jgi:nickel-dependent lactate racemase
LTIEMMESLSASVVVPSGLLSNGMIHTALMKGLAGKFSGQRLLILIPDHTRSLPLHFLFRELVDLLGDARQLDFLVALGTHPPLNEQNLNALVGVTAVERTTTFQHISFKNHAWDDPTALETIGILDSREIKSLAGERWHPSLPEQVSVRINKAALECDHILIIGPTFPHEVVGFSGGAKYLFPGISGPEMINATHWLGALTGVVGTIGVKDTPVRAMINAAARCLKIPVTLIALVVEGHDLAGMFIGDLFQAWSAAADLSAEKHIRWCSKPYQRVLSFAPPMYDELWTAAKAMYKLEPAVAIGGELIIYAPHLDVVSHVFGDYIFQVGYHILPFFLDNWAHYQHFPLGVLAHSTHLRGSGVMENGVEKPNVQVTLASKISADDCNRLNLGYLDPQKVNIEDWKDREQQGILYVPRAGELLYRLKKGF